MLKIRAEQIRPFEQDAQAAFARRVMDYVRENHAGEEVRFRGKEVAVAELSEADLKTMVENGLARARDYGLTWKSALNSFVVLMFVAAPSFDRHPPIARVLRDEDVPANRRLEIAVERTTNEDWAAIAEGYDEKSWETVVADAAVAVTAS